MLAPVLVRGFCHKVTPSLRACVCPHAVDGGGVGRLALLAAAAAAAVAACTIINI